MPKTLDAVVKKLPSRVKRRVLSGIAYFVAVTALVCAGMFSPWFFGFIVASGFYFILGIHCAQLDKLAEQEETISKWQRSSKQ